MRMYPEDMESHETNLEASLTRALEQGAEVAVPPDFAARVSAALPPPRKVRAPLQWSRTAAAGGAVVLGAALFLLAPHAVPTFGNLAFDLELLVLVELGGIAYWLTSRRGI